MKIREFFSNLRDMVDIFMFFFSVYNISVEVKSLSHSEFKKVTISIQGVFKCMKFDPGDTL